MSVRAAFFTLLGMVYDLLPADVVSTTINANPKLKIKPVRLQNVRRGGTADLGLLVKIVNACLPDYDVPHEIGQALKDSK
jgi:hypothetical protein